MASVDPRSARFTLRLPVRSRSVGLARRAAAQFAEEAGCGDELLWRVRMTVSEAVSNVVLHAHPDMSEGEHQHFELSAEADPRGCSFVVRDAGVGLRSRPDSPGVGLGLGLIARACDELELEAAPGGGTLVRMTFVR